MIIFKITVLALSNSYEVQESNSELKKIATGWQIAEQFSYDFNFFATSKNSKFMGVCRKSMFKGISKDLKHI